MRLSTVLLLIHDRTSATHIADMLHEARIANDILIASTPGIAIGMVTNRRIDVVLIDSDFEGAPGRSAVETMRAEVGKTPIIVLADADDEGAALGSIGEGADDYLVAEHLTVESLVRAIRYAIRRRAVELALVESEMRNARFREIIAAADDLVLVVDEWERVAFMNASASRYFGVDESNGFRSKAAEVLRSAEGDVWHDALPELILDGRWQGDVALTNAGGADIKHAVTIIHHERETDGTEAFYSVVGHDLSALTAAAEKAHMEQLIRAKDQFIASVSHELRTPLTAVLGFADLISSGALDGNSEETADIMRMISEQAREVSNIIDDLIVGARADVGTIALAPSMVDLGQQVMAVSEPLRIEVPHLEVHLQEVSAWADPVRVRQVIRNLLTNAKRYGGGSVVVDIASTDESAKVIVRDNGKGIPVEQRETIFEPYHTAGGKETRAVAVGLGLTVSRQLSRLMGGDLVYDYVDGWSQFELSLPRMPLD